MNSGMTTDNSTFKQASDLLLTTIENMDSMLRVIDRYDRVVFMNRKMREEFGDRVGQLCCTLFGDGGRCADCISEKCKASKRAEVKDVFCGGRYYRVIASPLPVEDGMGFTVEIFHDITEQKKLEVDTARHYAKLKADIDFAKQIQERSLPADGVYNNSLLLTSAYLPSEDLGGDLYDLVRLNDEQILFYVADVSGHGIRSSLFTIFLRQVIRGMKEDAADLTALINELIRSYGDLNTDGEQFFSILCGLYESPIHRLTLVNAGHNCLPLILRESGTIEEVSVEGLPICSILMEACHEKKQLTLAPGDRVLICTDGITEAYNKETKRYFGNDGLLGVISTYNGPRKHLTSRIVNAAQTFAGALPEDDMTVMVLEAL